MPNYLARSILWCLLLAFSLKLQALDLKGVQIVDLSQTYNEDTLYWPTSPSAFELDQLSYGDTGNGYFYSANKFSTPEHGGTHLDAPIHFFAERQTVDEIPLNRLLGPAVVIDIQSKTKKNPDYMLTVADIEDWEKQHGRIPANHIVLLNTGWSRFWPDAANYLGDASKGDASNLHFPSFGPDAAKVLVEERQAMMIGVDTASIDAGASADFMVHRISAKHNVSGLENLTNLDQLPPKGAFVIAFPMKIAGGSGSPVRVAALVPNPQ